jgi:hypothetical protein
MYPDKFEVLLDLANGRKMKNSARVCADGLIAGVVGAAIITIWFLFMDVVTHAFLCANDVGRRTVPESRRACPSF